MLKNIKIGNRLVIGFALILAFTITISLLSIMEINNIYNDTRNLYERPYMVSKYLRDIKINALNIRRYMLDLVLIEDKEETAKVIALIDAEEKHALSNFQQVSEIYFGNKEDLNEAYVFFTEYEKYREDVITMLNRRDNEAATEIMTTRNKNYVSQLFDKMQIALDNTEKAAGDFYQSALQTKNKIIVSLFVALCIMFLLSIFISFVITRSIIIPLADVVKNIRRVAAGTLSNDRLPESTDEIGQLAVYYNNMQEDLMHKAKIAERIAEGDFDARVESASENDIVAESINRIAMNFDLVVRQARKVAEGDYSSLPDTVSTENPLVGVLAGMLDSLKEVVEKARQVAGGDYSGAIIPKSKSDELALSLNKMTSSLRIATEKNLRQSRLKTSQNELNDRMRGDLSVEEISNNIVSYAASYTRSQVGALYIFKEEGNYFELSGEFAVSGDDTTGRKYYPGEGIIGQAAIEKRTTIITDLPTDFLRITSGFMDARPRNILVCPFIFNNETVAVLELCSLNEYNEEDIEFTHVINESVAVSILSVLNRIRLTRLLEITTRQSEELQLQQEELREINEELESQTEQLRASEEHLRSQQEELRAANEDLEEKTDKLQKNTVIMEEQNRDLEMIKLNMEIKARELEASNRYKSEFLANMSHELRTPLNSLLILAQSLKENRSGNLDVQQVEAASIILNSGNDLLNLINDILDLSKIESGKMNITLAPFKVSQIKESVNAYFSHIIKDKQLSLELQIEEEFSVVTDEHRLNQIVRNLMSNAIKFTEKGGIVLKVYKTDPGADLQLSVLGNKKVFAIAVKDTGIGIPVEKQKDIFEAFQQVDGSISRKYGGTGLGLSITRELTRLLGGEMKLISEPGKGSEFIVFLPLSASENYNEPELKIGKSGNTEVKTKNAPAISITDDRDDFGNGQAGILIIEDDNNFATLLTRLCVEKGLKYLYASTGEEGIILAQKFMPKGILLDIRLPGINGWEVLEKLKSSHLTRHIPVHVISVDDETGDECSKGVWRFLRKPVTREGLEAALTDLQLFIGNKKKKLLIVDDDSNIRKSAKVLLKGHDIMISECGTASGAFEKLITADYDCLVLDLGLPDISGLDLLRKLRQEKVRIPPVIIYTGRDLENEEHGELLQYTHNIILKGVKSEARLLDETSLFLHRMIDDMPEYQKKMMTNLYNKDELLRAKSVLIVDDDMRNVFALTQVLESVQMKVQVAVNGKKALEFLETKEAPDLILMDIMMPVMDGYEAMKRIRMNKKFQGLPIITLTAKAMKEDRSKSIAAGANDYLSKPVDTQKLFNLLRIWLYK